MLFFPRAPLVACEALHYAGLGQVGIALTFSNLAVTILFHRLPCVMLAWLCLVGLLLAAAIIAFWICLVRTYGGSSSSSSSNNASWGREKSASNAVIDGLACLYSRLLYECGGPPASQQQDPSNLV